MNANWTAPFPNSTTDVATFPQHVASPIFVVLSGGNTTVNGLVFSASTTAYTITGVPTSTLTLGGTSPSIVSVSGAQYTIDVKVIMASSSLAVAPTSGNTMTMNDVISGASALVKQDAGTVVLTASNTYTGGTQIQAGTLSIATDDNLGNAAGSLAFESAGGALVTTGAVTSARSVLLSAPAAIDTQANTVSLSGPITGPSSLTKVGGGTLIISGTNTYSGGTTVAAGTLQGNTTSLQKAIANNAAVAFAQNFDGTYSGVMSGTGSLAKTGTGAVTLTASNTYSGGTTVSAGTLQGSTVSLQGSIANAATVVFDQPGAGTFVGTLTGTGTTVKQNSGTLTLHGTQTQGNFDVNAGRVLLRSELKGDVSVAKGATFGGTGTVRGNIHSHGRLAAGASIGTMDVVGDLDFQDGSTLEVEFNGSAADLFDVTGAVTIESDTTLEVIPLSGFGLSNTFPIIEATAGVTGTFTNVLLSGQFPLLQIAVIYDPNAVELAVTFLSFTSLVNQGNAGKVAAYLDKQIVNPACDLACVISELRTAPNATTLFFWLEQLHSALYSGFSLIQENLVIRMNALYQERWLQCSGPWFAFLGDFTKQSRVKDYIRKGYRSATEGLVLGWDQRWDIYLVGVSGAFAHTDISWKEYIACGDKWDLFLTLYGSLADMIEVSFLAGYGSADAKRKIDFAGIHRTARHEHHDWMWDIHAGMYWPVEWAAFTFTPYGMLDFINDYQSDYKEKGANSINLQVKEKYANLLRPEIGVEFLWKEIVEASVGYIYEARFSGKKIKAKMQGAHGYFTVRGLNPNRSLFAYDLDLIWKTRHGSASLGYGGELGHKYRDQHITVKAQGCF